MYKHLVQETRLKTLELYKSLLRSSKNYDHLGDAIRQQFKSNKHMKSRGKTLALLTEAEQTLGYLDKGNNGDQEIVSKVNAYIQKYVKLPKPLPTPLPKALHKQSNKIVERKPYQVAIATQHAMGFQFKRVRGWRQPVKTSMMIKNKVKATQARIDKFQLYRAQLDMIRGERLFLQYLKCLPPDNLNGYEDNIKMAMTAYNIKDALRKADSSVIPDVEL
ncbi:hypothetical protein MAM1_0261d08874 [Mucor ambiguus]|uniref:Uncharacterized protein n=1 Tax=Mucor ambiguus TaxID=91626 RepID=A0A0C9N448_9FUNG|nr:hypothetical protein MAM1_0261d08874 [Mucor ambiguus]